MNIPEPCQLVLKDWESQGYQIKSIDWTSPLKRHLGARLIYQDTLAYAKLALAGNPDLDEPDMLAGLRREVWWSHVIQRLRQENKKFPFTSPRILATNVAARPFTADAAWIIMEYIDGQPIVDWEPERLHRTMSESETEQFESMLDAIINSLLELERIHPDTLDELNLPPLPDFLPHGNRGNLDRWQQRLPMPRRIKNSITAKLESHMREKIMANPSEYVLGNGAFEIKNFWHDAEGQLIIMDNEFAGWYPQYDSLSYLYHRLYCNTVRPDLARQLLRTYLERKDLFKAFTSKKRSASQEQQLYHFFKDFPELLKPRLLSGWYYDTVRRRLPPWHKKQRLRYQLYWHLLRNKHHKLVYPK